MPSDATPSAQPDTPFRERLVSLAETCERTGFDRTTVSRLAKQGKFPPLRKKGDRRLFVLESELTAWMHAR